MMPQDPIQSFGGVLPIARTDETSQVAHARLLERARQGGIDVCFLGDSIVRRWNTDDYPELQAHWNKTFRGMNAATFGCGGDTLQNILWRLLDGELDNVHPKVVVLLAGTNDVGNTAQPGGEMIKAGDILDRFGAVLEVIRAKAPKAVVVVTGIFPRNDDMAFIPLINGINKRLSELADGKKTLYLDANDKLADQDGKLFDGMTLDGLHPTLKGYQVWADALKPMIVGRLGGCCTR